MSINPLYLSKHSMSTHEEISITFYIYLLCDRVILSQTNQKCDYTKMVRPMGMSSLILINEELPSLETKYYEIGLSVISVLLMKETRSSC